MLLCSAVLTACGSSVESSEKASGTNADAPVSTEVEPCQPRGTGLVSVAALPQEKSLSKVSVTEVEVQPGFGFAVTIANQGCARESEVRIGLSTGAEFSGEGQIDELDPGKEATVVIDDLPLPTLEEKRLLHVEIEPVPAEVNVDNNAGNYAIFLTADR